MLLPVVVAAVLLPPTAGFAGAVAVFVAVAAWEWAGLLGRKSRYARGVYAVSVVALITVAAGIGASPAVAAILVAAVAWWAVAAIWVARTQCGREVAALAVPAVGWLAGWLTLVPLWVGLVQLHRLEPKAVLILLTLIWAADIGAFFAGRRFGRRKLASNVSPGKTWEGVLGGMVACFLVWVVAAVGARQGLLPRLGPEPVFVLLCLVTAAVSVLGDLTESMLKRRVGAKDSGGLIPGHGGVLDRIDSLTAGAPCFALGVIGLENLT